jgi:subtilase family serine protease
MKTNFKLILSMLAVATLTACGGGSDTGDAVMDQAEELYALGESTTAEAAFHTVGEMPAPSSNNSLETVVRVMSTQPDHEGRAVALNGVRPARAVVHTPASIRRLYGMPAIPADFQTLTPAQRAELGAGQTIYIVGAYSGANIAADLNRFSQQFGLGGCTAIQVPLNTQALKAHPSTSGCEIAVLNARRGAVLTAKAPAYNRVWAAEYALDVQWAHAAAPLARIVVLQAENNFVNSLADGIQIANRMGPGVVSMSWVAGEGSYSVPYEAFFGGTGMTYLAAAGDRGAQANWPATSPSVLSVGGTTLWEDAGQRREVTWSRGGGGFSAWFQQPQYQQNINFNTPGRVTGRSSANYGQISRAGADLAFNSDPFTGQYVVVTDPAGVTKWFSYGGTSIATPQLAGIISSANSLRNLAGRDNIGHFHQYLYQSNRANIFNDITVGNTGTQPWAAAGAGYDIPTGWGTPRVSEFVAALTQQ